jgi:hypothetical protein
MNALICDWILLWIIAMYCDGNELRWEVALFGIENWFGFSFVFMIPPRDNVPDFPLPLPGIPIYSPSCYVMSRHFY